jgi:hypothetical protein
MMVNGMPSELIQPLFVANLAAAYCCALSLQGVNDARTSRNHWYALYCVRRAGAAAAKAVAETWLR